MFNLKIKKNKPEIKFVFISGYSNELEAVQEKIDKQDKIFIHKPFTMAELTHHIHSMIHHMIK